jgi:hypothetical protein
MGKRNKQQLTKSNNNKLIKTIKKDTTENKSKNKNNLPPIKNKTTIKHKIKITSKIKKRFKFTLKKLKLDNENLIKSVNSIKLQNEEKNSSLKKPVYENFYLYIILKDSIIEEEGLGKNMPMLKNKLINIPLPFENKKICLINDTISENDKIQLSTNARNICFMTNEEFANKIKTLNKTNTGKSISNLNYFYQIFLADNKLNFQHKNLLKKEKNKLDLIYYQKFNTDYIGKIISLVSKGATLIKSLNNKSFMIKVASCSHSNEEVIKNIKTVLYKSVSLILEHSQKYNSVKTIAIESESSVPFTIIGDITHDDLECFE